jgi:hypothetical protein
MKTSKPFDPALYDADDNARDTILNWLNSYGWTLQNNPDPYGIDLIGHDRLNREVSVEVEVKHHWHGERFPFPTVHVSARKRKYIKPNAYIIMLNDQRTHALMLNYNLLSQGKTVTKGTIYTAAEEFIEVPAIQANVRPIA